MALRRRLRGRRVAFAALGAGRRGGVGDGRGRGRQRGSVRLRSIPVWAGCLELGVRGCRAGAAGRLHPGRRRDDAPAWYRPPRVAGGLLVALAWLVPYGFTFYGLIVAVSPLWAVLAQALVVPLLVGVAGTLWGGSAAAGRRIARLAGFSAGLGMFLYGTLAVAVIGAAGAQIDANWTVSANVDDRLGNNVIFYLWVLPLITAALGWAAAAATARIRPRLAVSVAAVPSTVSGQVGEGDPAPEIALPRAAGQADHGPSWRRTTYLLLLFAVAVAALFGLALGMLSS